MSDEAMAYGENNPVSASASIRGDSSTLLLKLCWPWMTGRLDHLQANCGAIAGVTGQPNPIQSLRQLDNQTVKWLVWLFLNDVIASTTERSN